MKNLKYVILLVFILTVSLFGQDTQYTGNFSGSVDFKDGADLDAFSRLRVSQPTALFDAQLTYGLQPLLFQQITAQTGATVTHDATNRKAVMTFASTPTGGQAIMQTYEHFRYQPGKSQLIFISFNMKAGVTNVTKFAGYSDGTNGIEFAMVGTTPTIRLLSSTSEGNESIAQSSWNLDKLDGTGPSGFTFDVTKVQILVIDFQALYVGRVRVGFDLDGTITYVHQFQHANNGDTNPYIQTANLPVRVGMTSTGTVSTTMDYMCSSVISEGGQEPTVGYGFSTVGTATAGSGTSTHILSIRPKTTYNSIANRSKIVLESVAILVTGANPVRWDLCIGQAISGTTTFNDVNTTYSTTEFNTAGTASGSPGIIIASGYVAANNQLVTAELKDITIRYPITLDAAGAVRSLGTLTLNVTGIGGTSATRAILNWIEVR